MPESCAPAAAMLTICALAAAAQASPATPIKATVSSSAAIAVDVLADSVTFRLPSFFPYVSTSPSVDPDVRRWPCGSAK